jgi:DNA polymerase-3 subunit delta
MAKGQCFLFLGPELGEKQDAIAGLRKGKNTEDFLFYAGEEPASQIAAALRNGSLFADSRFFRIKNAELFKKKDDVELISACLEKPQDDTTIVLISDETGVDKRLEKAVPPSNKKIFWELFENRKIEWVSSFFRREGCSISEDGIEAILGMVENNTEALRRECSRLILFIGKNKTLEADDVETWLSHSREESAFTLFSRLCDGDLERSLDTVKTLLGAKESPQGILAGLSWCFHRLRDYQGLLRQGAANDFELRKIGLGAQKVRRDYEKAARRCRDTDRLIALTADFDVQIRSYGSLLESLLMEMFVYKVWSLI